MPCFKTGHRSIGVWLTTLLHILEPATIIKTDDYDQLMLQSQQKILKGTRKKIQESINYEITSLLLKPKRPNKISSSLQGYSLRLS